MTEAFSVEQFTINIPDETLRDLKERLLRARLPEDFNNDDWEYGFNTSYLRTLIDYWIGRHDWRKHEAQMNQLAHFKTTIEGIPLHFIHMRGKGPAAQPLLIHHGWPWTFWDLKKVIGPLSDPEAYGGNPADAFDVVLISLPGHGFSSPLRVSNINFWRTADIEVTLMNKVLGYDKFFTAGGDWGALIVAQLGHKYADRVRGIYTHLPIQLSHYLAEHPDVPPGIAYSNGLPEASVYGEGEESWVQTNRDFFAKESGYGYIHLTKPQTLGVALNDSPAGLMAWIIEKRRTWADVKGNIESDFLRELIRTTLQEVLEAEMTEALGAAKGERTTGRNGYRSGYYGRSLITRVGKLELRIPQDRTGQFSTELFERYQRSERALVAALAEMYVQGVSTRKVKAITEELCGHSFSASSISTINKRLDQSLAQFAAGLCTKPSPT